MKTLPVFGLLRGPDGEIRPVVHRGDGLYQVHPLTGRLQHLACVKSEEQVKECFRDAGIVRGNGEAALAALKREGVQFRDEGGFATAPVYPGHGARYVLEGGRLFLSLYPPAKRGAA